MSVRSFQQIVDDHERRQEDARFYWRLKSDAAVETLEARGFQWSEDEARWIPPPTARELLRAAHVRQP